MTDNKNTDRECLPKLATGIRGLDKLLYDGINVNTADGDNNILIVIKGDVEENDKTLLGMQILYGLTQSIETIYNRENEMCIFSKRNVHFLCFFRGFPARS